MRKLFGLIGYPLSHSFSKKYFTEKFKKEGITHHEYELFPIEDISAFHGLVQEQGDLVGLNVTLPYKELVVKYLDHLDDAVKEIGACNTIHFTKNGATGYNTDVYGFELSLKTCLEKYSGDKVTRALILGTGGAAKAVAYVLRKLEIEYFFVSRSANKGHLTYDEVDGEVVLEYPLIINTTPVGTSPNVDSSPAIDYSSLTENNILFDLVYNPEKTLFLRNGEQKGCVIQNGMDMLYFQAEKAWEIWNT